MMCGAKPIFLIESVIQCYDSLCHTFPIGAEPSKQRSCHAVLGDRSISWLLQMWIGDGTGTDAISFTVIHLF